MRDFNGHVPRLIVGEGVQLPAGQRRLMAERAAGRADDCARARRQVSVAGRRVDAGMQSNQLSPRDRAPHRALGNCPEEFIDGSQPPTFGQHRRDVRSHEGRF